MRAAIAGAILLGLCGNAAKSDVDACDDAVEHYKSVLDDVARAMHRYANCVANSRGHDDCSTEFSTLRSAQDDFESAVSEYESDCS
jgi:hypothetical protein